MKNDEPNYYRAIKKLIDDYPLEAAEVISSLPGIKEVELEIE